MHRPWPQRALALGLAIWLVACVTAAAAVHRCPTHDGAVGMLASMAMGGHGAHHHAPSPGHAPHQCTCLGTCSTIAWPDVPPARDYGVVVAAIERRAPSLAVNTPRPPAPPHTLPFANVPPHALGA